MAPAINFLAGNGILIQDLSGSGLGFYGDDGFGDSVDVGVWQGRTFITDSTGASLGPEVNNIKYLNGGSGILGQTGTGIALTAIPNPQATVNIRFTSPTAVKVQNVKARIYDRTNPNNPASGVTTMVAELIHPTITQLNNGSGDTTWIQPEGSSVMVTLANSPGPSGLYAGNGTSSLFQATQHDWYLAISSSPDSIGAKTNYALYAQLEYL
jgi:hypothetical protein